MRESDGEEVKKREGLFGLARLIIAREGDCLFFELDRGEDVKEEEDEVRDEL